MLVGVVLVALNLRAAIAALAPLLPEVQTDLGMSRGVGGLLTTLPVLCFGGLAAASAWLGRRIGNERALALAMIAIVAGSLLRLLPAAPWLFAGTIVIGAAIAVGNVLTPSVIKHRFSGRAGVVTGLYTGALIGGAAIGAAISAPLAQTGLGWRGALLIWAIPALLAILPWMPTIRREPTPTPSPVPRSGGRGGVLRNRVTWALAVFMGMQSFLYFAVLTWMPAMLQEVGVSVGRTGVALGLFNVLGIVAGMVVPSVAGRRADQRRLAMVICLCWAAGILGLLLDPWRYLVWSVIAGLAQGAAISLVFALIVLRARNSDVARSLSGTVQSLGYLLGSAGPFLLGMLRDATDGWNASFVALTGVVVIMATGGWVAGRSGTIG